MFKNEIGNTALLPEPLPLSFPLSLGAMRGHSLHTSMLIDYKMCVTARAG